EVIAADGKSVAVTRGHPDCEVGVGNLDPGGEGGRSAMNGVKSVRIHVVGEAAAAADPADPHDVVGGNAELGHHLLDVGQDAVVTAARAPADILVRLEVFLGEVLWID